jgi:hypothetical protein
LVKRWYHQELAFEHFLRDKDFTYLAVDEAKRPVAVDKNFDFLVLTKSKVYAIDVKGKQIPYEGGSGFLWETWIHPKDLTGLRQWENMLKSLFRCEVESLIAYVYWIKEEVFLQDFETVYMYLGKKYGIKAITISEFEKHKETRSGFSTERQEWQLPRKHAKNLLKDINIFLSA